MLVSLKIVFQLGVMVNTLNPSTGKAEASGSKFEANPVYTVSFSLGRAT